MRKLYMKLLLILLVLTCVELYAGIVLLKNGTNISGQVILDNDKYVQLGYRHGALVIPKRHVKSVIKVQNISEHGKNLYPPDDVELIQLEKQFIDSNISKSDGDIYPDGFKTTRHTIRKGKWQFSFEAPSDWMKQEKAVDKSTGKIPDNPNEKIIFKPLKQENAAICLSVIETPPVTLDEQALLTDASLKAELGGFSTIYAKSIKNPDLDFGVISVVGTYGHKTGQIVVKTNLRATPEHTFVLTFFAPPGLYEQYRSVFSICIDSIILKKSSK